MVRREVWSAYGATLPCEPRPTALPDDFQRSHADAALLVSALSVAWTISSSSLAITIGIRSNTSVLVAFGAIGIVDAIGSAALVYHFNHSRRHDRLSVDLERLVHRIVLVGLFCVGCASAFGGLIRLVVGAEGETSVAGVALAAVSLTMLAALSFRKQQVASLIPSSALRSDGHLSAIGAMQAAVALGGISVAHLLEWHWTDAVATSIVGTVAMWLAISTRQTETA